MENNELQHWGIKGMKWGRRRFQNKDGSLTAAGRKRYNDDGTETQESKDERRSKALSSTNADEIYRNRDVLSTSEIRERMDRINVESQLAGMAAKNKKTAMDRVDKALKVGRKVNEVYEFTKTPVMKALGKKLGLVKDKEPKEFNIDNVMKNLNKMSDEDVAKTSKRIANMGVINKYYDSVKKASDAVSDNAEVVGKMADIGKTAIMPALKDVDKAWTKTTWKNTSTSTKYDEFSDGRAKTDTDAARDATKRTTRLDNYTSETGFKPISLNDSYSKLSTSGKADVKAGESYVKNNLDDIMNTPFSSVHTSSKYDDLFK